MKKRKKCASGSITVLLSLVMTTVLIMTAALTELSRTSLIKARVVMDCENAMASILAEYNRPLLERYNIFGMDGAYGRNSFNSKKIIDRMKDYMPGLRGDGGIAIGYGEQGISLDNYGFLTDKCGSEIYAQAVTYMKKAYGLDILAGAADIEGLKNDYEAGKDEVSEINSDDLGDDEAGGILSSISSIRRKNILSLIFGSEAALSSKRTDRGKLLTNRRSDLFKGAGLVAGSAVDKLLFQEYIIRSFSCYTDKKGGSEGTVPPLDYEIEYILAGHGDDKTNLGDVAKRLTTIREVLNFAYIQTDSAKKGEAEFLATILFSVTANPAVIKAATQIILAAWAYSESICDVRTLLAGKKAPIIKTAATWKTGLYSIFNPAGTGTLNVDEGLDYPTYLRVLLLMENEADKCGRAMDIMELNIRNTDHYGSFGMDNCIHAFSMQGSFNIKHIFTTIGTSCVEFGGDISYEMLEKR